MSGAMDEAVEKAMLGMYPSAHVWRKSHKDGARRQARAALEAVGLPALLERVEAAEGGVGEVVERRHGCAFCDLPQWGGFNYKVLNIEPLNPVVPGHRILIPRTHVERADSNPSVTGDVFTEAARWGARQGEDFNLIANAGRSATQSIDHLHIHYVPRHSDDGLALPWTGQADRNAALAKPAAPEVQSHG